MYFRKISPIFYRLFPQCMWQVATHEKNIYLTFDDGPTPNITEKTLKILEKYDAKATFFMLGKQVTAHPTLAQEVLSAGHSIGNHSFSHLNGWKTPNNAYFEDIAQGQKIIEDTLHFSPTLFRPPYGKITPKQMAYLAKKYQIVMMDILCGDFDAKQSPEMCSQIIQKHLQKGSIIVYHDSEKAAENMLSSLPETLAFLKNEGYKALIINS